MYKLYRNLNAQKTSNNKWSIKKGSQPVDHAESMYSVNVQIKQPSGQGFIKCLNGGHRSVFAWFKSDNLTTDTPSLDENAERVNFNPKNGDKFFHINGKRVDRLSRVWFLNDGTCYAIR